MVRLGMFVLKSMSSDPDDDGGGEGGDNFDPHKHRIIARPTTYAETMVHMLKGSLGAGMLAMPDAYHRVGLIFGVVGLFAIAGFATYCLHLLIYAQYEQCKRAKRGYMAYHKSMRLALQDGPRCMRWSARPFAFLVDFMMVFWQVGICAIYFVFTAENLKQVLAHYGHLFSVRMLILIVFVPQVIINLVRELKLLTPVSLISNVLLILGVLLVFWYLILDDVYLEREKLEMNSVGEIPIFIGITLFALEAVGVVLALEYNMDNPNDFVGMCGLLTIGMAVITVIFGLVGLFGCLKYGGEAKGSITLNLPEDEKKAQASKLLLAAALYLSIPLQNFVAYKIIWRKVTKNAPRFANLGVDFFFRIILIVIPFGMAVGAPSLSGFIGLLGALCLSLLAIIFPAMIDICIWYPDKYGPMKFRAVRDIVIIIIGLICLVSGVYTSVKEIWGDTGSDSEGVKAAKKLLKDVAAKEAAEPAELL